MSTMRTTTTDPNTTLRKFGHAKEGNWAPQVVVALAVTREGIPVRSWVLPGNTADVTTVEQGSRRSSRLESGPGDVCR